MDGGSDATLERHLSHRACCKGLVRMDMPPIVRIDLVTAKQP